MMKTGSEPYVDNSGRYRPLTETANQQQISPTMYLNIFVMSKGPEFRSTIEGKVAERVSNPLVQRIASKVVSKVIHVDIIAAKMAEKIPAMLPEKMATIGIEAEAEEVYRKGSFVVVRITVHHVDPEQLLSVKQGAGTGAKVGRCLSCLRCCFECCGNEGMVDRQVNNTMRHKIVTTLCTQLPQKLPQIMAEKGLIVDVVCMPEAEEAAFFFDAIHALQENVPPVVQNDGKNDSSSTAPTTSDGQTTEDGDQLAPRRKFGLPNGLPSFRRK